MRWDGFAWVALGGSASDGGASGYAAILYQGVSLALDPSGWPVIAWGSFVSFGPTYTSLSVARWTGSSWAVLGGGPLAEPFGSQPAVAVDPAGRPVVAYVGGGILVNRWTGSAWEELDGSGTVGIGGGYGPSIAIDGSGNPCVAWLSGAGTIYLKRWAGAAWEELAGSASGDGISGPPLPPASGQAYVSAFCGVPSLAIGASGGPVVSWGEIYNTGYFANIPFGGEVRLKQWSGSAWEEVAGSYSGGGISNTPSTGSWYPRVAARDGMIGIAWLDGTPLSCYLRRYGTPAASSPGPTSAPVEESGGGGSDRGGGCGGSASEPGSAVALAAAVVLALAGMTRIVTRAAKC